MTPPTPQPQQEYITDSESLSALADYFNAAINGDDDKSKLNRLWDVQMQIIRSRPHTPTKSVTLTAIEIALRKEDCPSKSVQWAIEKLNQYQEQQEQHDTAIRNATLDAIQEHAIKAGFVRYDNKGRICNYTYINPKRLLQKIESLRTQTQEHP
jgi:hypothetical protein